MKRNKLILLLIWLPVLVLSVMGCKKENFQAEEEAKAPVQKVGDFINNNFDFTLFAAAVNKAGLMDTLNNLNASLTVLVPTNEAFNADSILYPSDLDKLSPDTLRWLVRSHILSGKKFYSDIPNGLDNLFPNLNGVNCYFSSYPTLRAFYINGVNVTQVTGPANTTSYDLAAVNGVIHVLGRVLKISGGTVQDFLSGRPDLSDFVAAMKHFNLWDSLRTAGPITLYAINNAGMEARGLTADSINGMDPAQYDPVLFGCYVLSPHHLFVQDLVLLSNLLQGFADGHSSFPTSGGYALQVDDNGCLLYDAMGNYMGPGNPNGGYIQKEAPYVSVGQTDYACSNGVVQIISDLVVLPGVVHK